MDDRALDDLSKRVAAAKSRRGIVRALGGAVAVSAASAMPPCAFSNAGFREISSHRQFASYPILDCQSDGAGNGAATNGRAWGRIERRAAPL